MLLATWSAPPCPAFTSMRSHELTALRLGVLHPGDELARVERVDAIVVIGRHHQQRRVRNAVLDVVVGRIGRQHVQLFGFSGSPYSGIHVLPEP